MDGKRALGRVLVGKLGLDGHDRGAKFIARALREDGFEVIYTGIRRTAEEIAHAAVQEDVDVIGLSLLSGAHNKLFPQVLGELRRLDAGEIPVIGGGIIPEDDIPALTRAGVRAIMTPGTPLAEILQAFRSAVAEHRTARRVG